MATRLERDCGHDEKVCSQAVRRRPSRRPSQVSFLVIAVDTIHRVDVTSFVVAAHEDLHSDTAHQRDFRNP